MVDYLQRLFDPVEQLFASLGLGFPGVGAIVVILVVCLSIPWIRIFKRAGYSPGLGLLMFIPLLNIFLFLVFAYHEWPIERELHTPDPSRWR